MQQLEDLDTMISETETIKLAIGFDKREAVVFHTFVQSILTTATQPIQIMPLALQTISGYSETHSDSSNAFVYSRFLTPYLMGFNGFAIFLDGDMICNRDIAELWNLRDPAKAVQVAHHDYKTKQTTKYFGNKNENYPRKNWSSVIIWNCSHHKNRILNPEFVEKQSGKFLHRFEWLEDGEIGSIPLEWNWLDIEYDVNQNAKLIHYTLGAPCFRQYRSSPMSKYWHDAYDELNTGFD